MDPSNDEELCASSVFVCAFTSNGKLVASVKYGTGLLSEEEVHRSTSVCACVSAVNVGIKRSVQEDACTFRYIYK